MRLDLIKDRILRNLMRELLDKVQANPFANFEGKFFTFETDAAVSDEARYHGLGFVPTDVIITDKQPGTATVTLKSEDYTSDDLVFDTDAAVTFRCIIGRQQEEV